MVADMLILAGSPAPAKPAPALSDRPQQAAGLLDAVFALARHSLRTTLAGRASARKIGEQIQILREQMALAESYGEWAHAARHLDVLEGCHRWKETDSSDDYYNPALIASRTEALDRARCSGDVSRMLHLVRTSLCRDLGGMGSGSLYNHSHIGTKTLVHRYVAASVELVRELIQQTRFSAPPGISQRDILDSLVLARKNYGRSALVLSGGSVYGMAHIGVLKALFSEGLLPRIVSGTSAGSIVAAVVCTKKDDEIPDVMQRFAHGDLAVFTDRDNPDPWLTHLRRAVQNGAWHDSKHISRVMRETLGDITFQEAFYRTGRILNITVSSKPGLQLPSLLNYMTAPNVVIWSAVVASCSVPGVFDPRPLLIRDEASGRHVPWDPAEQLWIDGSLDNDIPVERLGELLGVNHFIVSQANPHIVVFVTGEEKRTVIADARSSCLKPAGLVKDLLYRGGWLVKLESQCLLNAFIEMGYCESGLKVISNMLNQKYTGDINIIPKMSLWWAPYVIRNPTPEFMLEACRVGERSAWPNLSRIDLSCAVELALDRAISVLRERVAFSESQVNLRRFFAGSSELGITQHEARLRHRHGRRLSGGSIQLSARRQLLNRGSLDTVLSESHDSDPESNVSSLAIRRGKDGMNLSSMLGLEGQPPPYRGPIKQNSLQHLPMPKTPAASPGLHKKLGSLSYGFGVGGATAITPLTRLATSSSESSDDDCSTGSPGLSLKSSRWRGPSPARASSSHETDTIGAMAAATEHDEELADDADVDDNLSDPDPYGTSDPSRLVSPSSSQPDCSHKHATPGSACLSPDIPEATQSGHQTATSSLSTGDTAGDRDTC